MGRAIFWVVVVGCISSLVYFACQKEPEAPALGRMARTVLAGHFAPGKLQENYARYGFQFPGVTQEQFWIDAQSLLNSPAGPALFERIMPNGDVRRFRASTGEWGVMDKEGRILVYKRGDQAAWAAEAL